jgi:hypothetical protein
LRTRYVVPLLAVVALLALLLHDGESDRAPLRGRDAGGGATAQDRVAEQEGAEATETAQAESARWWLTFLGPGDRPLADVPVTVFPANHVVRTDASGTAALTGPEGADFLAVGDPFTHVGRVLQERRTVVRMPGLLPLEVEFRAVDTGRPWAPSNVRLVGRYGELALEHGRTDVSPLSAERWHSVEIAFDASSGMTTLDGLRFGLAPYVSVDAARVRVTVALWPELDLTVRVVDLEDRPVREATVKAAYLDEQFDDRVHAVHVAAAPTDGDGRTRVRGVPHVPGLPLTVVVEAGGSSGFEETTIASGKAEMEIVALDDDFPSPSNTAIGIGGGAGPQILGALAAEVFRRDGRAAAGAHVSLKGLRRTQRADAGGRLRFDRVPPGRHTVWLAEPGLVPTSAAVEVGTVGVAQVTLREPEGWTLRVRTVDAEGRPLPFRPLAVKQTVSRAPYALLEGNTQVVPLLTGPDGTLLLTNLGEETIEVSVRIRGHVLAQATVPYPGRDGASVELRLK